MAGQSDVQWTTLPAVNPVRDIFVGETPGDPGAPPQGTPQEHGGPDTSGAGYQYREGAGPDTSGVGYEGSGMASGGGENGYPQ